MPGEPVAPRLAVPAKRFRKPAPSGYPIPAAIGDRDGNLWPTLDRLFRPPPCPHGQSERLVGPFQKRAIEVEAVFVECPLRDGVRGDPSRPAEIQCPPHRDFIRSRACPLGGSQPPPRHIIPVPAGRN